MERSHQLPGIGPSRPDCAYFLLLGLCGAAFLLTIGGILTYVAFNPGAIDGHPHSALSHIPHFHHHPHPHHQDAHSHPHHQSPPTLHHPPPPPPPQSHTPVHHANATTPSTPPTKFNHSAPTVPQNHTQTTPPHPLFHPPHPNPHPSQLHHPQFPSNSSMEAAYEAKAKQSLVLAIIGPLCLLMGIVVTLIVGVLALKYDCDERVEPNISFLRLRSEMSLNFDPDKNNYELLRPSSSIEQAGGHFSINPTGLPDSAS